MSESPSSVVLAWLLTYLIHSTLLLGAAWALTRVRQWPAGASDVLWKTALLGAIVTASVQLQLDLRPAGSVSLVTGAPSRPLPAPPLADERTPQTARAITPPSRAHASAAASNAAALAAAPRALPSLQVLVLIGWAAIALALTLLHLSRRLILVGRLGDRRPVVDGMLLDQLRQLADDAGVRLPRLTTTARISSPIALGMREICVPESALTDLDAEQQRSMLAHELAHLARRDPVWLTLASLLERVLWFQPLNRLARRRIATSAEFLCDEWAVGRTGSGVALARCLAQVAEWVQASPLGVPVAGMAEERSLLVSRVEKLLAGVRPDSRSRRAATLGAAAVVVATITVAPSVTGRAARAASAIGMPGDTAPPSAAASLAAQTREHETVVEHRPIASVEARDGSRAARDSAVVTALIGRLGDEDADVRRAAAEALGKLEDARAVPALVTALSDREAGVRSAAAQALGRFGDPRAVAGLVRLLDDREVDVRKEALEALSEYESGVPADALVRLLKDQDADVRRTAVHMLGKLRDPSTGSALAPLVRDESADVRRAAIESLAELRDVARASTIVSALGDADADVREQALDALEELRVPIPESTLLSLLRDRSADVRAKAAELAGERLVTGAIPTLRRMIDDPDGDVREHAVSALASFGDDVAVDALRAALGSKDANVRRAAAESLGDRRP